MMLPSARSRVELGKRRLKLDEVVIVARPELASGGRSICRAVTERSPGTESRHPAEKARGQLKHNRDFPKQNNETISSQNWDCPDRSGHDSSAGTDTTFKNRWI
jgi:hypothetical protein